MADESKIRKIRFIENENPARNSSGGIITYIINLTRYYKDIGAVVRLIGVGSSNLNQLRLFEFHSISEKNKINNSRFFILLFFSNVIKKINSDEIIHVQRPEMVIPLKLRTKNKIVCTLHGGQDIAVFLKRSPLFGIIYSLLLLLGFYFADHLICVDKRNYMRYLKKYPWIRGKLSLVPIGINDAAFKPLDKTLIREKYNISSDEKIILFVGRLEFEKNIDFLITSLKQFLAKIITHSSLLAKDLLNRNLKK